MDKFINKWGFALIVMSLIFAISSIPGKTINAVGLGHEGLHIDGHFAMFIVLCIAYYKATKNIALSVFLTVLFGITDELHQLLTPNRSCSLFDIIVDSSGALFAALILWKQNLTLPKTLRTWLAK